MRVENFTMKKLKDNYPVKISLYTAYLPEKSRQLLLKDLIRTLKGKLFRYMTHQNTKKYIHILPDISKKVIILHNIVD